MVSATFIVRWRNTEFSNRPITIADVSTSSIKDLKLEIQTAFGISAATMKLMGPCMKLRKSKSGTPPTDDSTPLGELRLAEKNAPNRLLVMGDTCPAQPQQQQQPPQQQPPQQQPPQQPQQQQQPPQQQQPQQQPEPTQPALQLRDIEHTLTPGLDERIQAVKQNVDQLELDVRSLSQNQQQQQQQQNQQLSTPTEKLVQQIDTISELLMRELLKLDALTNASPMLSPDEFRLQRKQQVQRIQLLHEELDDMRQHFTQ